jgi:hypothetical protein
MRPATGKQKSRRTEETSARRRERARVARGDPVIGVVTVAATCRFPELVFTDEFVEVLKEADEDDEERAGEADEKKPGEENHDGMAENDHRGILTQVWRADGNGMRLAVSAGRHGDERGFDGCSVVTGRQNQRGSMRHRRGR